MAAGGWDKAAVSCFFVGNLCVYGHKRVVKVLPCPRDAFCCQRVFRAAVAVAAAIEAGGLVKAAREWLRLQLDQGLARLSEPGVARASSWACSTQCSTAPQAVAVPAPALQWVLSIKPFTLLVIGQTRARPALVL